MDNRNKGALRSYALTSEPEMPELEESVDEMQAMKDESERITAEYASLERHPGWQRIKKDFEKAIANYRSGAALASAALDPNINDAELGKLTRSSLFIADELEKRVLTVEGAAMALEEKDDKRSKRRRN